MKFGVRECADVVLRAKTAQKIGNKIFYKNEPVCYFDTLKTSTMEGSATTVFATGGRGNARLISWDGERTLTFTMEDALISPIGLSILTGAGLIETSDTHTIKQHITERVAVEGNKDKTILYVSQRPYDDFNEASIYVMALNDNGEVVSEPYLYNSTVDVVNGKYAIRLAERNIFNGVEYGGNKLDLSVPSFTEASVVLVDYYTEVTSNAFEVNITPDKFGGTFYLEASTLWRDQATGKDYPAEFIIPSCKVQSNFSFTMSGSGDPSSFTFTMDAFPDYTRWNKTEKVLATIQVIGSTLMGDNSLTRSQTWSDDIEVNGNIVSNNNYNIEMSQPEAFGDYYTVNRFRLNENDLTDSMAMSWTVKGITYDELLADYENNSIGFHLKTKIINAATNELMPGQTERGLEIDRIFAIQKSAWTEESIGAEITASGISDSVYWFVSESPDGDAVFTLYYNNLLVAKQPYKVTIACADNTDVLISPWSKQKYVRIAQFDRAFYVNDSNYLYVLNSATNLIYDLDGFREGSSSDTYGMEEECLTFLVKRDIQHGGLEDGTVWHKTQNNVPERIPGNHITGASGYIRVQRDGTNPNGVQYSYYGEWKKLPDNWVVRTVENKDYDRYTINISELKTIIKAANVKYKLTTDTTKVSGKKYYQKINTGAGYQEAQVGAEDNPSTLQYYEIATDADSNLVKGYVSFCFVPYNYATTEEQSKQTSAPFWIRLRYDSGTNYELYAETGKTGADGKPTIRPMSSTWRNYITYNDTLFDASQDKLFYNSSGGANSKSY